MGKLVHNRYVRNGVFDMAVGGKEISENQDSSRIEDQVEDDLLRKPIRLDELALQFKIKLKYISPPVWRRVLVPADWTFEGLHEVIQAGFGWREDHLHNFLFGQDLRIETADEVLHYCFSSGNQEIISEQEAELVDIFSTYEKGVYTYDFGDNWEHEIFFEKILAREARQLYPRCIKLKGLAPAEDANVSPDELLEQVNLNLALLIPATKKYLYHNSYEWGLRDCLDRQKLLTLKVVGQTLQIGQRSKMRRQDLIDALVQEIPESVHAFMTAKTKSLSTGQKLFARLVINKPGSPFETETFLSRTVDEDGLDQAVNLLKSRGLVFDLADLDVRKLPACYQEDPQAYFPILIIPDEVREKGLDTLEYLQLTAQDKET